MKRLLILGAGASIEECKRSGNSPDNADDLFPTMSNFCKKLFQREPSPQLIYRSALDEIYIDPERYGGALSQAVVLYLNANNIPVDRNPIDIFCDLEKDNFEKHNIEILCEFVWNKFGSNPVFWESFIYEGIYFHLFYLFTNQFGLGMVRKMEAGTRVVQELDAGDIVINLNYDICFDHALEQSKRRFCYVPNRKPKAIRVIKPHGSMNLYFNINNGKYFFKPASDINGSIQLEYTRKNTYSPYGSILPPRLNKNYEQHPFAADLLSTCKSIRPEYMTFWGIGFTESDNDLIEIYKRAASTAHTIEVINPDATVHRSIEKVLSRKVEHFKYLSEWFAKYGIPDY